jgi:hypothetical protein
MFTPRLRECEVSTSAVGVHRSLAQELRAGGVARSTTTCLRRRDYPTPSSVASPVAPGFTLVRTATEVEVGTWPGAAAVPPRNVMEDVLAMSVPSRCAAPDGGDTVRQLAGRPHVQPTGPCTRHIAKTKRSPAGSELEIDYRDDGIVVRRSAAVQRAVLQATPPPARDVSDEDER